MLALLALCIVLWKLSSVVLLTFTAVLVAVGFRALAALVGKLTNLSATPAMIVAVILAVISFGGFSYFLGGELVAQGRSVFADLPAVLASLGRQLGIANLADTVMAQLDLWFARDGMVENVLGLTASLIGTAGNALVAVTVGIYLAFRPAAYQAGLLRLFPPRLRPRLASAFDEAGGALNHWLRGQLISMLLVGVLTSVALLLLGIPSWLALGVLAGLLEFIPFAGPFIAAVPALLIALGDGGSMVFWVAGAYVLVQQLQGSVITPLIQQRMADLPAVLAILALTGMGFAFGPIGVLLAVPAAIVGSVFVKRLYVRDALHDNGTQAP